MTSNSLKQIRSLLLDLNKKEKQEVIKTIIQMEGESILSNTKTESKSNKTDIHGFYNVAKFYFSDLPPLSVMQKNSPATVKNMEGALDIIDQYCVALEKTNSKNNNKGVKIFKVQKQSVYNMFFYSIKIHFEEIGIPFLFNTVLKHKHNFRSYLDNLLPDYSTSEYALNLLVRKRPKSQKRPKNKL